MRRTTGTAQPALGISQRFLRDERISRYRMLCYKAKTDDIWISNFKFEIGNLKFEI